VLLLLQCHRSRREEVLYRVGETGHDRSLHNTTHVPCKRPETQIQSPSAEIVSILHRIIAMATPVAKAALRVKHELHGVVVSAGLMDKTAKVRTGGQVWNSIVNKVRATFDTA
jgi:hypothetical protein